MSYHTDIMLIEILDLYSRLTNNFSINLEKLERTFYSSQDLINAKEELETNNIFDEALNELLDKIPDYFTLEEDELIFNTDIDIIYDELLLEYENDEIELTDLDNYLGDYLENIIIYKDLELPIPLNETKDIFSVNFNIVSLYKLLAKYELENKDNRAILLYIKVLREQLNNFFNTMDSSMQNKLKMCCAHYNSLYLVDEDDDFINSNWNIILFSKRQMIVLNYAEIETKCFNGSYDKDEYDEFDIDEIIEDNTFEEIPYFLTNYLIYLNNFINYNKNTLANNVLEELLLNKYLLLSIPELKKMEDYYLENLTIDSLENPPLEKAWLTDTSFELLLPKVMECALSLDYSDEDINNYPHLHSKIITNCLFIKTFIDLSINENHKKDIISQITVNKFYKNAEYKITTNLIDEIIFTNDIQLKL